MTARPLPGLAAVVLIVNSLLACPAAAQPVEKQKVVTITSADMDGGILVGILWAGGAVLLQGVVADANGELSGRYLLVPEAGIELRRLKEPPPGSEKYWETKARRVSPTGLGQIKGSSDQTLPMYGISGLEQRISDAYNMGGMQEKHTLSLGGRVIHERQNDVEPFDGEIWSWSPPELNRIAYVDGKGDLWAARADGSGPRRLLKGDFTLPAWSPDGRAIAIAERKDGGRKWEISVVHLPPPLSAPDRP